MIQRQVRDQPPEETLAQGGAMRRSGRREAANSRDRPSRFRELKSGLVAAEGKITREVPVQTRRLDLQSSARLASRLETKVDERKVDLRASISRGHRRLGRAPARMPVGSVGTSVVGVLHREKGPEFHRFSPGRRPNNPIDRIDLEGRGASSIGNDLILEAGMRNRDGIGALREQIDNGRAAKLKRVGRDVAGQVRYDTI